MKLVVTIDTEEDDWGVYRAEGCTLRNLWRIPALQDLFDAFNVKPTYLITYPVAASAAAVSIFKPVADRNKCEIGTHCHPWNTPPFEEECNSFNSMLCHLPPALQFKKLHCLHKTIEDNFGLRPVSFRAGRWGYDAGVGPHLLRLGYAIDTSVTAYTDWTPCHGPDFSDVAPEPYVDTTDAGAENGNNVLAELPATVGYLQTPFSFFNRCHRTLTAKPWRLLKVHSVLRRARLLNKVSLSPETASAEDMIRLTKIMMQNKYEYLNMFFHSTSLIAGLGPFVKTRKDEISFLSRIRQLLVFAARNGIKSVRLCDVAPFIRPHSGHGFSGNGNRIPAQKHCGNDISGSGVRKQ